MEGMQTGRGRSFDSVDGDGRDHPRGSGRGVRGRKATSMRYNPYPESSEHGQVETVPSMEADPQTLNKHPAVLVEYIQHEAEKELLVSRLPGTPVPTKQYKKRTLPLPGAPLALSPGTPEVLSPPVPPSQRNKPVQLARRRQELPVATPFRVQSPDSQLTQSDTVEEALSMASLSPPSSPDAPSPSVFVDVGGSGVAASTSHSSEARNYDDDEQPGMDCGSDAEDDSEDECQATINMQSVLPDDIDPLLIESIRQMDQDNDEALLRHIPPDATFFDWVQDMTQFNPNREAFTGTAGPTFPVSELQAPVDAFLKIWDTEIIDLIVKETNRYAHDYIASGISQHSRLKSWKPTTREEIYIFFAVRILQSVVSLPVEREYFYNYCHYLSMPNFKEIMPYNRYLLLKRFLHFSDNSSIPENLSIMNRRLYKVNPIIRFLNTRFKELYRPQQNIVIDESLLKWSGPLSFLQRIKSKAAKVGIKSYELCESRTGYLWAFKIYAGKDSAGDTTDVQGLRQDNTTPVKSEDPTNNRTDSTENFPTGAVSKIVYDLIRPLLNKGHTLILDNFYTSPLLARCLKLRGTDCYGTLRLDRDNLPSSFKMIAKNTIQPGEVISSTSGDVVVLAWRNNNNMVGMISTYHRVEAGAEEEYGTWKYKPQVVLDYNLTMGGVDKKDQLLSSFPIERTRNAIWYKKLFARLLNVSVLNAYIIYKWKNRCITHRTFRREVAEDLINMFKPVHITHKIHERVRLIRQIGGLRKPRPVLDNNHYTIPYEDNSRHDCVWCKAFKKRARTRRKCNECNVTLCIDCMVPYHTGVRPE